MDASLGYATALRASIRLSWKGLLGMKPSLLQKFVKYGHNRFYNIGARSQSFEEIFKYNNSLFLEARPFQCNKQKSVK